MRWLLRSDVEIFPASEREGYVVLRPRSRFGPTLVDADGARLLERFRTPVSIPEAIQEEPLAQVSALLQHLVAKGILVSETTAATLQDSPLLQPGDRVAESTVLHLLAAADDSEVHQVRLDGGGLAALKLQRKPAGILDREARVLARLGGGLSPALLAQGEIEDASWLLLEWRSGIDPVTAAREDRQQLFAVAQAYADLHEQGVVHGDVHRRNILAGAGVTLLDFGLARSGDEEPPRAGVPFYFEPEYARAELADEPSPPVSPLGEQYAVAALLYLMATGLPYLDFHLERRRILRQIAEEEPLPFSARGVPAWPEFETILRRGLAKDPAERFPSLLAMAGEIGQLSSMRRST